MRNAKSPIDKTQKGTLLIDDKLKHRRTELEAAAKSQQRNEGKVLIRKDAKTVLLVSKDKADQVSREIRLSQANDPKNLKKRLYLEAKGWNLRNDGLWLNRYGFLIKDFEAALELAGYYEWLKKEL